MLGSDKFMDLRQQRLDLYNSLIENQTAVMIADGKNKDKFGTLLSKSKLKNDIYYRHDVYNQKDDKYQFYNYFTVILMVDDKKIYTSCNNIKIIV
jgi:hypothetical protein